MGLFDADQVGTEVLTTTQRVPPWLETPLQGATGAATNYFGQYGSNPYTTQGLNTLGGMATDPSQIGGYDQAFQQYGDTLGGNYLYGNPGFNAAFQAAANDIQPRVASQFNRGGRLNSGLAQAAMTQELGDAFAGLYGQERGRQMQALGMAPQMTGLATLPGELGYQVGQRFDAEPESNLDDYIARLGGIGDVAGRSELSESPLYGNTLAGLLGLGASGLGLLQGAGGEGGIGGLLGGAGAATGGGASADGGGGILQQIRDYFSGGDAPGASGGFDFDPGTLGPALDAASGGSGGFDFDPSALAGILGSGDFASLGSPFNTADAAAGGSFDFNPGALGGALDATSGGSGGGSFSLPSTPPGLSDVFGGFDFSGLFGGGGAGAAAPGIVGGTGAIPAAASAQLASQGGSLAAGLSGAPATTGTGLAAGGGAGAAPGGGFLSGAGGAALGAAIPLGIAAFGMGQVRAGARQPAWNAFTEGLASSYGDVPSGVVRGNVAGIQGSRYSHNGQDLWLAIPPPGQHMGPEENSAWQQQLASVGVPPIAHGDVIPIINMPGKMFDPVGRQILDYSNTTQGQQAAQAQAFQSAQTAAAAVPVGSLGYSAGGDVPIAPYVPPPPVVSYSAGGDQPIYGGGYSAVGGGPGVQPGALYPPGYFDR